MRQNLYILELLICFIAGVTATRVNTQAPVYVKLFPWFILFTFLVESLGIYLARTHGRNHYLYNFFYIVEFYFWGYCFYSSMLHRGFKKVIIGMGSLYIVIAVINITRVPINDFHTWNFFIGAFAMVFMSARRLFELFKEPVGYPVQEFSFWMAVGILFFYSSVIPLHLFLDSMRDYSPAELKRLANLFLAINIVYYWLFIVGFIVGKRIFPARK